MRLIYITVTMPFGSKEAFLIPEVREMLRRGWQVLIVPRSPRGRVVNGDAVELEPSCVRQPLLSAAVVAGATIEFFRSPLRAIGALALLLRRSSPATMIKNLAVFPKGLWLARLARLWKAQHIHAQWILTTSTLAMIASHVSGVPWSCTAHRGDIAENNLLALKVSRASFVRFISQSGVRMAESLGAACQAAKVPVIHMGVALPPLEMVTATLRCANKGDSPVFGPTPTIASRWCPAAQKPGQSPHNALVALCAANLLPVKGHDHLLRAWALLRDRGAGCVLEIAGAGCLQQRLRDLVEELRLQDAVRFLGYVSHGELLESYRLRRVDIVVLASVVLGPNFHEGIPVTLMEAMACGIPVVSTDTGGIPELLHDGAGMMVPAEQPVALADALERLIRDADLRASLGKAGRRRVEEQFSLEGTVSRLAAQIEQASICS
jgi:colanic acid/amylovoran biosynthesis glycosyltransferase